jgi:ferrochelatase
LNKNTNTAINGQYDALLVVSFGGPEGMDDVMPFLENVLRGRNIPRQRMLAVAKHYELFGGVSPINEQNRKLIAALKQELESNGPRLPIYFGNRNWHPLLPDTLRTMRDDGVKRALAFVTSAYSSYSSCRQYLDNIANAQNEVGCGAPEVRKLRAFYNHPLFIDANVARIQDALAHFAPGERDGIHLVFTAHSIPESMASNCDYAAQLSETSRLIAERGFPSLEQNQAENSSLAYQSRSGSPAQPWLGPDICDHLKQLSEKGVSRVIIAPIGFVSDHMEIIYDLDIEAAALCKKLGITMYRAATVGTHPHFIRMIRELILEQFNPTTARRFLGTQGARNDQCPPNCCLMTT